MFSCFCSFCISSGICFSNIKASENVIDHFVITSSNCFLHPLALHQPVLPGDGGTMANGGTTNGFDFSRSRFVVRVYSHDTSGKSKSFSISATGEEMNNCLWSAHLDGHFLTPKKNEEDGSANILYPGYSK